MTEPVSAWLTLLGLVPFVLGIGMFLVYLKTRQWQENVLVSLEGLRAELRGMQQKLRSAVQVSQAFSVEDPEPYGGLVEQVIQRAGQCEMDLARFYEHYARLHTRNNQALDQSGFSRLLSAPEWYRLDQQTQALQADIAALRESLDAVAAPAERLGKLGWEMASQSRLILQMAQSAGEMFRELSKEALLDDPHLDTAWQDTREWEATLLAQVPVVYYQDDETAVLSSADKETTAHVYRVVKAARPAVESLMEKAKHWQSEYARLASLMQEAAKSHQRTAALYSQLQQTAILPVRWEKTRAVMIRIEDQLSGIGRVARKRSLEEMASDLAALESLVARLSDTENHVQWIAERQNQLSALAQRLAAQREERWLEHALGMFAQASKYDAENFLGEGTMQSMGEELKHLAVLWDQVLAVNLNEPVREGALPALAQTAEQAARLQESLRAQSDVAAARLEELLAEESELRDQLLRSKALLAQVTALIGSNPFLKRQSRGEHESLLSQLEILLSDVDHPAQGTVESKVRRYDQLAKRLEQAFSRWAELLEKEVTLRRQELVDKTDVLGSKVKLDEPVLVDTIRLIRNIDLELFPRQMGDENPLLSQMERLKALNQAYHSCTINLQRLDEFAGTVLEMYSKAEKYRQSALEAYEKAQTAAPETLKWPPSTQHMSNEPAQIQVLERQWASLQQEPLKAIQMAGKLSDLSERYQSLHSRLAQLVESGQQEQNRVLDLEKRLEGSQKMWQRQMAQWAKNRQAQSGIQALLDEIERDHAALKQRYERGVIQYPQALQGMRQVCRRIDEASVPLDEHQAVDITGTVQRRM